MTIWPAYRKAALELQGAPLEATYGKQGLEVRAPARLLCLFSHSRLDHTQKASKFPKRVCDFCHTLPLHVPEVSRPLCSQSCSQRSHTQQEIKSNSDSTVGGRRTASHKARGTNSSALPRAQPSQAGNAGTAWEVQKPPSSSLARQLPTSSKAGASFMGP